MKKTELDGKVYDSSVGYETIGVSYIQDIHKFLMKKHIIVQMLGFIKQTRTALALILMLCFGGALAIKCVSMNNEQCMVRPTLIDLNLDELHYYLFIISMNRCDGSCNTVEDPFRKICVPNEMEDVKLTVFDTIKRVNISKTLAKHISCQCRCEFDENGIMTKVNVSVKNQ